MRMHKKLSNVVFTERRRQGILAFDMASAQIYRVQANYMKGNAEHAGSIPNEMTSVQRR
jgi:hypothetical protein